MAKQKSMKDCPECGCSLKPENYAGHMQRVHSVRVEELDEEYQPRTKEVKTTRRESQRDRQKRLKQDKTKAAQLQKKQKTVTTSILLLVVIVIGVAGAYIIMNISGGSHEGYQPTSEPPNSNSGTTTVTIPVSGITTSAEFHTYDANGVSVRYFLTEGSDGQVHLATDACDVCYDNKKGYRQTGDLMTCNNCGQTFAINSIGTDNTSGGCWPSYIPMSINSGNVVINKSDLGAKRFMFD